MTVPGVNHFLQSGSARHPTDAEARAAPLFQVARESGGKEVRGSDSECCGCSSK